MSNLVKSDKLSCGHEYMDCGRAVIGGVTFNGYKCVECGHELALQVKEGKYEKVNVKCVSGTSKRLLGFNGFSV